MLKRFVSLGVAVVPLLVILSACGLNMSGEPEIVSEREVVPTATRPVTQVPAGATEDASAAAAAGGAADTGVASAAFNTGMQLYLEMCASCHGANAGVGPALNEMRDVAATRVAGQSADDYLHESIVNPSAYVVPGFEDIMPKTFGEQLSAEQVDSLVTFIKEFTPEAMMAAQQGGAQQAGDQQAPAPDSGEATLPPVGITGETLTVTGKLIQGTQDGQPIPAGQEIELYALDAHGSAIGVYNATSDDSGHYEFKDVPRAIGNMYFVRTDYSGVPQGSQVEPINGDEDSVSADITLYERTTDKSTVAVTWAQVLVNYAPIDEFGIEVRLDLEIANNGDKIVTTDKMSEVGWPVSVMIDLPAGAFGIQPMQAENSSRYQVELVNSVPVVEDSWPLRPQQVHKITVLYYLPYTDGAVLDQAFGFPVMDASVLLPNDTVSFESDQFDAEGQFRYQVEDSGLRVTELAQDAEIKDSDPTLVKAHDLLKPLGADDRMIFTLSGKPTRTINVIGQKAASQSSGSSASPIPYFLAGMGATLLGLAAILWWRQRRAGPLVPVTAAPLDDWAPPGPKAGKDALLRAIAELDDAYEAGELDEETYQERRDLLKERLVPLMRDER